MFVTAASARSPKTINPSRKAIQMTHTEIVGFIWDVANLIRDSFKRGKYQDVILPLTVLRRLDCVLAPTKEKVLARKAELGGLGLEAMDAQLKRASGFAFYNTSQYNFERLLGDAPELASNLRNYIVGFSDDMRAVIERFDFDNTISKLDEAGLLYQVVERFGTLDLHPDLIDNPTMGTIFEELIRRFNEALDENPGEHFTPRDVVHLMVELMLAGDEEELSRVGIVRSVYDPCCGSGGMLMIAKERIVEGRRENGVVLRPPINPEADIHLFGQEVNPETWAVSRSDFFMKEPKGRAPRATSPSAASSRTIGTRTRPSTISSRIRRTERTGSATRPRSKRSTSAEPPVGSDPDSRGSAMDRPCSCFTCLPTRSRRGRGARASRSS